MTSTPDAHDPDWKWYPETILVFPIRPRLEIDLRAVVTPEAVSVLTTAGFGKPFAIMTACDPGGRNLSPEENERRQRDLENKLSKSGHAFVTVDCCSPDRSHCECSVAVKIPQAEALALARELDQIAIFWFDGRSFWIIGAVLETDPVMLPRSS